MCVNQQIWKKIKKLVKMFQKTTVKASISYNDVMLFHCVVVFSSVLTNYYHYILIIVELHM